MNQSTPTVKPPQLGDGPVVFIGAPTACRASVYFQNGTDHKLKVKELVVQAPKLGSESGELRPRVKARVGPRQHVSLPVRLPLQRSTPPGVYEGTVQCGEQEAEAQIHVLEYRSARVRPSKLELRGRSGETIDHVVSLENTGNVAFKISTATLVSIEEEHWIGRSAVVSLRNFEKGGFDRLMDVVTREVAESLPDPVDVRLDPGGGEEIEPGEDRLLELRIELPKDLKLGRKYRGSLELGPTRVGIFVECTGQVASRKKRASKSGGKAKTTTQGSQQKKKPRGKRSKS